MGWLDNTEVDRTPRYAPNRVMTVGGMRPVVSWVAYPPGQHPPDSASVPDCTLLVLTTDTGENRSYGCERAYINSELHMVVIGFPARFEEMAAWKVCKRP